MRTVMLVCVLALAGCNTMNGLGHDVENAGANLSHKADPHHEQERMAYPDDAEPEPY